MRVFRWFLGGAIGLIVLVSVATYGYIHFIEGDPPERLSIDRSTTSSTTGGVSSTTTPVIGDGNGTWTVISGSEVGYRVKEVLFGQNAEAVGRTTAVTGSLVIDGQKVTRAEVVADLASVESDQSKRDDQFRGRIMDTERYPTATFTLAQPIALPALPSATTQTLKAVGDLTLRGVTKPVTFDVKMHSSGNAVEVSGTIPIEFANWSIPNPSFGGISTEDHGELELLIVLAHKG